MEKEFHIMKMEKSNIMELLVMIYLMEKGYIIVKEVNFMIIYMKEILLII